MLKKYESRLHDMNALHEMDKTLITYNGSGVLTQDNICLIKGESGSGKGRLVMNMMVGFSGKEDGLGFKYDTCPADKYVVYINTEMSKGEVSERMQHILKLTGRPYRDRVKVLHIEGEEYKFEMLNELLDDYPPHVVIIDQVGDFCDDINNIVETKVVVKKLSELVSKYNCGGIIVMHQNENAGSNGKARGHVGSFLEQKVISSLSVTELSSTYKIKSTKMRSGRAFEIQSSFAEETKMLTLATDLTKLVAKEIKSQMKEDWIKAIQTPCTKMEFYAQSKELGNIGLSTAQKKLESLIQRDIFAIDSITKRVVRVDKKDDVI
jgi:RecA-family ATPase